MKRSNIVGADFGLFALRRFPANSLVGWYSGEVVFDSGDPGGTRLTDEILQRNNVADDPYQLQYRNNKAQWVICQPKPFKSIEGAHGYMGLHLMNNFLLLFGSDSRTLKFQHAKRMKGENNVFFDEDGSVWTNTRIEKGTEIMCAYDEDDIIQHSLMQAKPKEESNRPCNPKVHSRRCK